MVKSDDSGFIWQEVDKDIQMIDCDDEGKIICLSNDIEDQRRVKISNKVYNWNRFNIRRMQIRYSCKFVLEMLENAFESQSDKGDIKSIIKRIEELTDYQVPYSSFARK